MDKAFVKICFFVALSVMTSCEGNKPKQPETVNSKPETVSLPVPNFNGDSAYAFTAAQVAFGPRVPGTPSHLKCAEYLVAKLKSYNLPVMVQQGEVTLYDNRRIVAKNIIARYNPDNKQRILLCSHWDSRPFADQDTVDQDKPIDAASDGASGVGRSAGIGTRPSKFKSKKRG